MKCLICDQRKGKRECPAKGSLICPQCCGEKRVLEIDCPESCEFLKIGRRQEASLHAQRLRPADPRLVAKRRRILTEFREQYARVEGFFAIQRFELRTLTDEQAAEALDRLLDTLRTEDRGIIFEHMSNNPLAEVIKRELGELIDVFRNPQKADAPRLRLREAIEILECVREVLRTYMEDNSAGRGYVDTLARIYPRESRAGASGSSIIIPGR